MLTQTTTALLEALRDCGDSDAWGELDARYRPVLLGLARHLGLEPEDAADAAQETLLRFSRAYRDGKYDRSRGSLHGWMLGIARHCIVDCIRPVRGAASCAAIRRWPRSQSPGCCLHTSAAGRLRT